jgi:hypothetical protein
MNIEERIERTNRKMMDVKFREQLSLSIVNKETIETLMTWPADERGDILTHAELKLPFYFEL